LPTVWCKFSSASTKAAACWEAQVNQWDFNPRLETIWRRQAALEINDSVVQGLTAALYALELEDTDAVRDYVRRTLDSARAIITDLVGPIQGPVAPGDLVRTSRVSLGD